MWHTWQAEEVGVDEMFISRAQTLMEDAKRAQSRADAATAKLLLMAAPTPTNLNINGLKQTIKEAEQAGARDFTRPHHMLHA